MNKFVIRGALLLAGTVGTAFAADAATTLTGKNGMTLYVFDKASGGTSACYGDCATNWPPYLSQGTEAMGEGWASIKRTDGSMQWTYDGKPVYFFKADKKAGDVSGDGKGGVWHAIRE